MSSQAVLGSTMPDSLATPERRPLDAVGRSRMAPVSPKATILIVDDEPDVREVLEEYFVAHGYAVRRRRERHRGAALAAAKHPIDLALRRHPHARRGRPEPRAAPARALREDRDRHADFRGDGGRSDRRTRDGRRRLRAQAVRPARARGARQERAAPHVGRESRRDRRRAGAHRALRARPRRASAHRRNGQGSADVAARVRPAEGARRTSEPRRCRASASSISSRQRDWDPFDRSVDLRIMRLRKKIEPDPEHPRFIRTVRNEGYIFVPDGG